MSPKSCVVVVAAVVAMMAMMATSSCVTKKTDLPPVGASDKAGAVTSDRPVTYAFDPLDERPVSSSVHRGKPTILVILTTGDILGQAQVDYLVAMAKNDGAKVNYAVVAVHPRKEIVLVAAYISALKIEFPVALGDPSVMTASGPFGEIAAVPTVVILDREGKIAWKHTGLAKAEELRGHLRRL